MIIVDYIDNEIIIRRKCGSIKKHPLTPESLRMATRLANHGWVSKVKPTQVELRPA